jgi:uracil-DNA glycosylase family 4
MPVRAPERTTPPSMVEESLSDFAANAPPALRPLYLVDEQLVPLYETIADCPSCNLARTRSKTVPGSGPVTADLMLIGEGPGQHEDELGLPFVGRSGQFLDQLLAAIDLTREDVYVTNVVKCRPPENRDPETEEIEACGDYLEQQIEMVNPRVIVTLGRFSMAGWFPGDRISRIHGQYKQIGGRDVIPMYHPAAALRNGSLREVIHQDFAKIPALLQGKRSPRGEHTFEVTATPFVDGPPLATPPPSLRTTQFIETEPESIFDRPGPLPGQEPLL